MVPEGVSVTLVEPHYPVNLGHTARLMMNFGIKKLYLVNPRVDISAAAVYASHASGVLDGAEIVSLRKVRQENELLVATTAVRATKKSNVIRRTVRPEGVRELLAASKTSSLVFGRDTTGLTNEEIQMCDVTTTIDTSRSYRALNLGHAVAIMLYVISRGRGGKGRSQSRTARLVFADGLYELAVASRLQRHKVTNLREAGKRIAATSSLSDRQLQLLGGVFRKAVLRIDELQGLDSKT
ncbi:MAG TPA: TrmH family RNA methyltransferase [Nitrososphaerales archaeon]|nr:TrmH family RNA methyltransferase [Nitrososphaerales archaeon]